MAKRKPAKKKTGVKTYDMAFQRAEKDPKRIEERINNILEKGMLIGTQQIENPSTGRLYYTIAIDNGQPSDTIAKVFREHSPERMQERVNELIINATYKMQTWSVSARSNFVTKTVYIKS